MDRLRRSGRVASRVVACPVTKVDKSLALIAVTLGNVAS